MFEIWWPRLDEDWLSCSSVWLSNWSYYFPLLQDTDGLTSMSDSWRGINRSQYSVKIGHQITLMSFLLHGALGTVQSITWQLLNSCFWVGQSFKNLWAEDTDFFFSALDLETPTFFLTNILLFVSWTMQVQRKSQ